MTRAASEAVPVPELRHVAENELLVRASSTSSAIRMRLAFVAGELRRAAEITDDASDRLLLLADRFDTHARAGEQP